MYVCVCGYIRRENNFDYNATDTITKTTINPLHGFRVYFAY